jgi:hypothetical protein
MHPDYRYLRNHYGYVIWGNNLTLEQRLVHRTGFDLQGFVRELPIEETPAPVRAVMSDPTPSTKPTAGNELLRF